MHSDPGAGSFEVRPRELLGLADELAAQREAVRHPADRLAALGADPLEPGAFAEAFALREAHTAAALRMNQLAYAVAVAVGFAEEVTRAVATGYQAADESVADSYQSLSGRG
ncbi:hypothetical protein [Actinoplanes sp. NPDC049599]|uniref:hypothetical protein n=1 Tax=Actinoplanes sp. NPDC049599 TaxID=3363903 RepID=UPI00378B3887